MNMYIWGGECDGVYFQELLHFDINSRKSKLVLAYRLSLILTEMLVLTSEHGSEMESPSTSERRSLT